MGFRVVGAVQPPQQLLGAGDLGGAATRTSSDNFFSMAEGGEAGDGMFVFNGDDSEDGDGEVDSDGMDVDE
jgi:hypothetical protein